MAATHMLYLAIFSLLLITLSASTDPEPLLSACNDYKECQDTKISNKFIDCHGWISCESATIESPYPDGIIDCSSDNSCTHSTLTAQGDINCNGASACKDSPSIIGQQVLCGGYGSCYHSSDITYSHSIFANDHVTCSGSYACNGAHITSAVDVMVHGKKAAHATNINAGNDVLCDSHQACTGSIISSKNSVRCGTHESCTKATLRTVDVLAAGAFSGYKAKISAENIDAFGSYSIAQATVDSEGLETMNVNLYGYFAGIRSTVICRTGSVCNLDCKWNACKRLNLLCFHGSSCDIKPVQCIEDDIQTFNGIDCPLMSVSESEEDDENLNIKLEKIEKENKYINIYGADSMEQDDNANEYEDEYINDKEHDDEEDNEELLHSHLSKEVIMNTDSDSKLCGKFQGCLGMHIDTQNAYCYAASSCSEATLIELSKIECNAKWSCSNIPGIVTRRDNGDVQCNGYGSCTDIKKTISSIFVECNGEISCESATIASFMSVTCDGFKACAQSLLFSEIDDIICHGTSACSESTLDSELDVVCSSTEACIGSKILAGALRSYGYKSAADTVISAAKVIGSGYQSLSGSQIDSLGQSRLTVRLYGHEAGKDGMIICRTGSKCSVSCKSTGCYNTILVCLNGAKCTLTPSVCSVTTGTDLDEDFDSDSEDIEHTEDVKAVSCPQWRKSTNIIEDIMLMAWLEKKKKGDDITYEEYKKSILALQDIDDEHEENEKEEMDQGMDQMEGLDEVEEMLALHKKLRSKIIAENGDNYDNMILFGCLMISVGGLGIYSFYTMYRRRNDDDSYQAIK